MSYVRRYPDYSVVRYPQDKEVPDSELIVVFGTNGGITQPIEAVSYTHLTLPTICSV